MLCCAVLCRAVLCLLIVVSRSDIHSRGSVSGKQREGCSFHDHVDRAIEWLWGDDDLSGSLEARGGGGEGGGLASLFPLSVCFACCFLFPVIES